MANRNFATAGLSLEKRVVRLFADVTIGGTGAPTLVAAKSKGVKSITRTSAGLYVLTLTDAYVRLLGVNFRFILAAGSFPAAPAVQVTATTVGTGNPPTITFQCNNPAGTVATDPASGEELLIAIELSDSSAF